MSFGTFGGALTGACQSLEALTVVFSSVRTKGQAICELGWNCARRSWAGG